MIKNKRIIDYRPDIDGLRTIAVLLVLIFHFKLISFGKGGFLGVDIFFVISGFLITSIILKKLNNNTFSFGEFYIRRIRRLAPALFTVLILVFITGSIILLPSDYEELSRQIISTQLYFSNLYFWQNINYFGLKSDSTILLHTWSLSVEEQFYLLFPVVLFLIHKYQRKFLVYWIFIGLITSFFLNIYFVESKSALTFYSMPTRAWEFLAGALIIYCLNLKIIQSIVITNLIGFSGFLLIFFAVFYYSIEIVFPGFYAVIPVVGTMLLIISSTNKYSLSYKLLSNSSIVYIGKISYSLYLVHWPINVFASITLGDDYSLLWRISMFLLTFLIAAVIYHHIETPVREGILFKSKNKHYKYYLSGIAISIFCFAIVTFTNGVPQRFSDDVVYYANFANDTAPEKYAKCSYNEKITNSFQENLCIIGDSSVNPEWIIIGDSHALAASAAFNIWLNEQKKSSYFIYRHACPPLSGLDLFRSKGECYRYNQKAYDFIIKNNNVKNIVLISTWIQAKEGILTENSTIKLDESHSIDFFKKRFSDSLNILNKNNKNVYLWFPVPGAKDNVPKALAKSKSLDSALKQLEKTSFEHLEQFDFFYEAVKVNEDKIYNYISPYEELCSSGYCQILNNKMPIYRDTAHIAYSSSEFWSEIIERQLDKR
jgi:peptidoglycan/LPS O-acetylase OafA/YrhL